MPRKVITVLGLIGGLALSGCLPPKTVIGKPESPVAAQPIKGVPETQKPMDEEARLEQVTRKLEEAEQRLLEAQKKEEEALKKMEKAARKNEEAADRIRRAQDKIEALGQKASP
jgi:hypothetical protein